MGNAHILRLPQKYFWGKLANLNHVASEGALRVRLYSHTTNRWQTSTRSQSWLSVQCIMLSFKSFLLLRAFPGSTCTKLPKNLIYRAYSSQNFKRRFTKDFQFQGHTSVLRCFLKWSHLCEGPLGKRNQGIQGLLLT